MGWCRWVILAVVVLIAGFGIGTVVSAGSTELDGRTYVGVMVEDGTKASDPCEFHFDKGKFRCTVCEHLGFASAEYFVIPDGKNLYFAAEVNGKTGAHMSWEGRVTGDLFEGEVHLSRSKQPTQTRWFNAALQPTEN